MTKTVGVKKKILTSMMGVVLIMTAFAGVASADTGVQSASTEIQINVLAGEREDAIGENPSEVAEGLFLQVPGIDDFGSVKIESQKKTVYTDFEETTLTESFLVEDLRGTHEGWKLSIGATPFKNEEGITLPEGSITFTGIDNLKPVNKEGVLEGEVIGGIQAGHTIIDQGSVDIAVAKEGEGMGTHQAVLNSVEGEGDFGVVIDPKTAKVGNYETILTWTLHDTPTGN